VAYYHCISRDNPDRQWFLDTLAEACVKAGWQGQAVVARKVLLDKK